MYHIFTLEALLVSLIHFHQTYLINGIMTKEELMYDAPLKDPEDDILDRKQFAESFAKSIIGLKAKQEFVYGLYGRWGSGKSTIINFIEHFIEKYNETSAKEAQVLIFRFNPWIFSGAKDLTVTFLSQLRARLRMRDVSKKLKKCANKLELLENILSVATPVVKFIPGASEVIETGKNIISGMKNVAGSTSKVLHQDLHHIKDDIVKQLQNQKGKVLIIIDDLDRLLDEEVKNLMKMIKAVCDFPQTIYLLACDSKKVAGSLGSSNTDGHNYLEKIVQCTFNIPPPSRDKLNKLFLQNLEQIFELSQNKDLLFDKIEWGNLFYEGISPCFKTPRNVKTLINSIKVHYPVVQDEVNITDFVGVQALRVFYPKAYTIIDNNSEFLTGGTYGYDSEVKRARDFYENLHKQVQEEDLEYFKMLMSRLFANYKFIVSDNKFGYDSSSLEEWRMKRKVCIEECFDTYFTLFIPEDAFTLNVMAKIITLASDQLALKHELRSFIKSGRYNAFLRELLYFTTNIPVEKIQPMLQVIYDLSDELPPDDDHSSFVSLDINTLTLLVSSKLTRCLKQEQERFELLKTIFKNSESISTVVQQAYSLYSKAEQNQQNIVTSEHAKTLSTLALSKIKEFVINKKLSRAALFTHILFCWQGWESKDVVKEYVKELIKTNQGIIDFITGFLSLKNSQGVGDTVFSSKYYVSHKNILNFVEESEIALLTEKIPAIIANDRNLKDRSKKALEEFINHKNDPEGDL